MTSRRARIVGAVCACLLAIGLSGCGGGPTLRAHLRPEITACASSDCGGYAVTLEWSNLGYPNTTGYYMFANGTQVGTTTSSPYTFTGMDCNTTFALGVEAHDGAGNHSQMYTTTYTTPACGGTCSGAELCVALPKTSTAFSLGFGTQDGYGGQTPLIAAPGGGSPTVYQRLQNMNMTATRALSYIAYDQAYTAEISPTNYYQNNSGSVAAYTAWDFALVDKELSESPANTPKEVDEDLLAPPPLWYCPTGAWSNASTGCTWTGSSGLIDQSYSALASYYANIVRYFRTGVLETGSGTTTFTANSLTDSGQTFTGAAGDCVTATVLDANGFPDWVTGTVASATTHTITLAANWSTSESYAPLVGGSIPSATPTAGAAYNLASCTPPGGLSSPQNATPWPLPPSVGNVQYFEIGNEPDLSNYNQGINPPSVPPPSNITLTGVNVTGGALSAGTTYYYEIASDGVQATGTGCSSSNVYCGGFSLPSSVQSITLPAGDNAVQISWLATSNDDQVPQAYEIYGRTSGNELGLAVVGKAAAGGLAWTDKGTVTPAGSPSSTDYSAGGQIFTPGMYTQIWNVVAPAMKAIDSTIKLTGPAEANSTGYGEPSVDTSCVTTNGPSSTCVNGDPGFAIGTDYIPTLLTYATTAPSVITFHAYGAYAGDTPESGVFSSIADNEVSGYNSTDKTAIANANVPVWIDEGNYNAGNADTNSYRSMTQAGSAWLANDLIDWAGADPAHIANILQWSEDSLNPSYMLFGSAGTTPGSMSTTCIPQPSCQNIAVGQPDLEYWAIYEIDHLLTAGNIVTVSNVPSGFAAMAVQTSATNVVLLLVNKQQGADNGNGASSSVDVQLQGSTVTDAQLTAINGSTSMSSGPSTSNLGAEANVSITSAGYEVDLLDFTI